MYDCITKFINASTKEQIFTVPFLYAPFGTSLYHTTQIGSIISKQEYHIFDLKPDTIGMLQVVRIIELSPMGLPVEQDSTVLKDS